MVRLGSISIIPPTQPKKFIAEAVIQLLDENGAVIVTIRDIQIGLSEWGGHDLYCSLPVIFHKQYGDGGTELLVHKSVEFGAADWHAISRAVIDEYRKLHPEPVSTLYMKQLAGGAR